MNVNFLIFYCSDFSRFAVSSYRHQQYELVITVLKCYYGAIHVLQHFYSLHLQLLSSIMLLKLKTCCDFDVGQILIWCKQHWNQL